MAEETNRSATIKEAMDTISEYEDEAAAVNAKLKAYHSKVVKGVLGMKIGDFNAAYRLYKLEGPARDNFLETVHEVFNALGVGNQLNWVEAAERATAGAEVTVGEEQAEAAE